MTPLLLLGLLIPQEAEPRIPQSVGESDHLAEGWLVEVRAVFTNFDNDLRIEDAPGIGAEVGHFGWNHGGPVAFRAGFYAWETENEKDEVKEADVRVRQYFVGMDIAQEDVFRVGLRLDLGAFTYSGGGRRDAAFMAQLGFETGFVLHKHVAAGFLWTVVVSHSDFNRGSEHVALHASLGLGVSVRF